jgi:hypothetical protein
MSRGSTPRALNRSTWKTKVFSLIEQMLQRGIGDDATVPEMIRSDFDHRKRRRQGPARQNMLGLDLLLGVVKIDKIAGQDVNGTD